MNKLSYLAVAAVVGLTGCATAIDHASQKVNFQAVGATDVLCDIDYGGLKYQVRPPQTIVLSNSRKDMELTCQAAGNRVKHMTVPSTLSGWTAANVTNGIVPGVAWDAASGAWYKFPEVIIIDFSDSVATMDALPSYEALDAVDPRLATTEDLGPSTAKLPGDDAAALRHRMAQLQRDQDDAVEAEKIERKESLEGGWDGDKGGPHSAPTNTGATYTPPAYVAPVSEATPPLPADTAAPAPGTAMPQPLFPATTSFNP